MDRPFLSNILGKMIIAISVIVAAAILGGAWKRTHSTGEKIYVTGQAQKDFVADLIVWSGSFSKKSMTLQDAYASLKNDVGIVKNYLISKGIPGEKIIFSSVGIRKDFRNIMSTDGRTSREEFDGYVLTQSLDIESKDVDKVEQVSREITELINQGVEFYSEPPSFYYTKLSDLKIEMIANATKDARNRAEKIAENSGGKLGALRMADLGVFQITGQHSNEDFTYGGAYNTSSKNKTVTVTARLEFGVE